MLFRLATLIATLILVTGCSLLPEIEHQPTFHNPFPQLSRVGVAPFINLTTEATLDTRQIAQAYFNELQSIPGFEVVPIGVIEQKARSLGLELSTAEEYRYIARELKLDAIVVGVVTDYSPYYPPRLGLSVDWHATNPCFHPIPVGYGLPWGTTEEEEIPQTLVQATEFELAREQLKTQTPQDQTPTLVPVPTADRPSEQYGVLALVANKRKANNSAGIPPPSSVKSTANSAETGDKSQSPLAAATPAQPSQPAPPELLTTPQATAGTPLAGHESSAQALPVDWPDPRGLIPEPPSPQRPACRPSNLPVLTHTRIYNGHDIEFTKALENYYAFRDDARFGGWQGYMQRSEDFLRFCCHLHITEMLTARGGAGETRVLWRWHERR
ncbi:MAG: hypothetical protein SFX18_20105 [Pirellulales bacterium]|nr:hypothetical protein [Pirellulales bacterium]